MAPDRTPSHNIIAACVVAIVGCAGIALWQTPWLTVTVLGSALLGYLVGIHVMAVRTGYWTETATSSLTSDGGPS